MSSENTSGLSVRIPESPRIARARALKESDWKAGSGQGLLCFKICGVAVITNKEVLGVLMGEGD